MAFFTEGVETETGWPSVQAAIVVDSCTEQGFGLDDLQVPFQSYYILSFLKDWNGVDMLDGEFWELKSAHLKAVQVEEH